MTADEFRQLALSMPAAVEHAHMSHPDFRVGNKIFATLDYPTPGFAMVKLTPEQQAMLMAAECAMFSPAKGAWGRSGSTLLRLDMADKALAESAVRMAWGNLPK